MGANNQPRDSSDSATSAKGLHERRMVGDFDDSANALWTLHEREAKSHDEARIQSLKDDMDGVLIFVRFLISLPRNVDTVTVVLTHGPLGWSVFRFSYVVHHRQNPRPPGGSRTTSGVLQSTKRRATRPDLPTNVFSRPPGSHPIHSSATLPYFYSIFLRYPS